MQVCGGGEAKCVVVCVGCAVCSVCVGSKGKCAVAGGNRANATGAAQPARCEVFKAPLRA